MFRNALEIAESFTIPIIVCRLTWNNQCSASIGTGVVVNTDGWVATAGHIVKQIKELEAETVASRAYEVGLAKALAIGNPKEKQAAVKALAKPAQAATKRYSVIFGTLKGKLGKVIELAAETVDFGLAKLDEFDPEQITTYPTFKDPATDIKTGVSLCKLGFPFAYFTPTWDGEKEEFKFPANLSLTRFPIDGMLTRMVHFDPPDGGAPFPLMQIETSTPGLKGQSGGPTVDVHGTVWAIQCKTAHLSLGFDPQVPGGNGTKEHQFLNVGRGVHPATMLGLSTNTASNIRSQPTRARSETWKPQPSFRAASSQTQVGLSSHRSSLQRRRVRTNRKARLPVMRTRSFTLTLKHCRSAASCRGLRTSEPRTC